MTQVPELVAHRGDMIRYPENTLSAFKAVIDAGARFVEFDIQMSGDGIPIVIHDLDLERVAGVAAHVKDMNASELEKIKAEGSSPPVLSTHDALIPTLKTTISFMNAHTSVMAFVEIKTEGTAHCGMARSVDRVLAELESAEFPFCVISYSIDIVRHVRKSTPCPAGWVLSAYNAHTRAACVSLAPEYVFCDISRLPSGNEALWPIGCRWVIYDIRDPGPAMTLFERGAEMIETGDIITLLNSPPFASQAHD